MNPLSTLKLTAAKRQQRMSPTQQRRMKLVRRLAEQIALAQAEQAGEVYAPKRLKNVRDANGLRQVLEVTKRVKPWWWQGEGGKLCLCVRYGARVLELAKGKNAVEVGNPAELVVTLETLRAATEAGDLDAQLELTSGSLRTGFKK